MNSVISRNEGCKVTQGCCIVDVYNSTRHAYLIEVWCYVIEAWCYHDNNGGGGCTVVN